MMAIFIFRRRYYLLLGVRVVVFWIFCVNTRRVVNLEAFGAASILLMKRIQVSIHSVIV